MNISAKCKKHPEAKVLMLEATIGLKDVDGQPICNLEAPTTEAHFDIANTYCTADDPHNHDIVFQVFNEDGHWLCDAE